MTEPTEPTYIIVQQVAAPEKRRFPRWAVAGFAALLLAGAGAGTFASFSASTTNDASFSTGTLVLTNKVNSGNTCYSSGTTATNNVNTDVNANDCEQFWALTVRKPGDGATADLDLRNDGTIDGTLSAYSSATCTATNDAGTYHGTGDLCSAVQIRVQEFADATARTNADATGGNCRYGANMGAGNLCSFDASHTLSTFGALTVGSPLTLGSFTNQTTRYFQISVQLPLTATNDVQGRKVTNSIVWRAVQ